MIEITTIKIMKKRKKGRVKVKRIRIILGISRIANNLVDLRTLRCLINMARGFIAIHK